VSASRATQHLAVPPSPDTLRGRFPVYAVPARTMMYRCHRAKFGPWWFGTSLRGRFDLPGPDGTCYTAESELITLLETWGGIQLIPSPEIAQRVISAVVVNRELRVADATSNAAIGFGMTAEISTTSDYALRAHPAVGTGTTSRRLRRHPLLGAARNDPRSRLLRGIRAEWGSDQHRGDSERIHSAQNQCVAGSPRPLGCIT
jgi:hypothetical protein